MWDSDPKGLQATIEEIVGVRTVEYEITFRAMFGGVLAYTCGRPFASLSNAGLAIKLSGEDRTHLIEHEDGYPLRYEAADPPSKSYTVIPKSDVEAKGKTLEKWLIKSIEHCRALPLKKKKPRKTKQA